VAVLYAAFKGMGTNETAVMDTLASLGWDQRVEVANAYRARYRKVGKREHSLAFMSQSLGTGSRTSRRVERRIRGLVRGHGHGKGPLQRAHISTLHRGIIKGCASHLITIL